MRTIKAAAAIVLVGFVLAACGPGGQGDERGARGRPGGPPGGPPGSFGGGGDGIPAVEAVEVTSGTLPLEQRLAGSVRARNQTQIFAEVSGQIVEVLASNGDYVEAGQPLVRLRDNNYRERVRQAEAGLSIARARLEQAEANLARLDAQRRRVEAMAEDGLISTAEVEAAQADARSAEADLQLREAELEQAESLVSERRDELAETVVRAPIEGVVGGRNAEVGQHADTGTALFVIGDTSEMLVDVTLTQRMLAYIHTGTSVNVYSDAAPEEAIEASISRISPFLHPVTRTTDAEIEVAGTGEALRPGMFVTVDVLYGETEIAPLIPNNALRRDPNDGREGVYAAMLSSAGGSLETTAPGDADPPSPLEPVGPVEIRFVPIEVIARGRLSSAVRGVQPGDWVVTLGHDLIESRDAELALIQPTPWDHIMRLQQMQTRDLIDVIRARQEALTGDENVETLN